MPYSSIGMYNINNILLSIKNIIKNSEANVPLLSRTHIIRIDRMYKYAHEHNTIHALKITFLTFALEKDKCAFPDWMWNLTLTQIFLCESGGTCQKVQFHASVLNLHLVSPSVCMSNQYGVSNIILCTYRTT